MADDKNLESDSGSVDLTKPPASEQPGPEQTSPEPVSAGHPAPVWARRVTVAASVLVVALVAAGAWLLLDRQSASERDERREAFVQAARQTVLNLTTIHADSADADVQRLLDGATGDFKAEFEGREGPFVEVVQQAGVTTVGEVLEAGLQTEDGTCAASLVASRAMVSNADQPEPEPRDFRLRVTICDEDGSLLASKVEFVP
jgi:Mce-associated membrane protein